MYAVIKIIYTSTILALQIVEYIIFVKPTIRALPNARCTFFPVVFIHYLSNYPVTFFYHKVTVLSFVSLYASQNHHICIFVVSIYGLSNKSYWRLMLDIA